mgnify:CR=1 FL=1
MQRYAVIGTRHLAQIHRESLKFFNRAIDWTVAQNAVLVTGGAVGADRLAAERAAGQKGAVDLVLPWFGYELSWVEDFVGHYGGLIQTVTLEPTRLYYQHWMDSVDKYHPASAGLSRWERLLHARNYGIVEGASAVFALPQPPERGGTSQGMRIARGLGIPVFNLSMYEGQEQFIQLVKGIHT